LKNRILLPKTSASVILCLLVIGAASVLIKESAASTNSDEAFISVPYHYQITSYYCGPAALEMVFDFYGPDISQLEIADVARTAPDGTYTPDMMRAAHFSNASTSAGNEMQGNVTGYSARKFGYVALEHGGMTISELKALIAAGYPIVALTTWHYRVAVGYSSAHITFQDSLYGPMYNMTYDAFDSDWDYSGHWALLVAPLFVDVSAPEYVLQGSLFNVTASITHPWFPPFSANQYPLSAVNATIILPSDLSLVSGEAVKKATGSNLMAGKTINVTWAVRAEKVGTYSILAEAEGKVAGWVPPLPSYSQSYYYEDRIGGVSQSNVTVVGSDIVPPNTTHNYNGKWHTSDFTIDLTATDDPGSINQTYYEVNDGPTSTINVDGHPKIMSEGANNTLEYWSTDNAGNEEFPHNILTQIKLDKTTPTGSISINDNAVYTTSTSVTLSLTASDTISGIHQVRYSNDGVWDSESWQAFSSTKTWTLDEDEGIKTVYYQIKDQAELTYTCSDTIILDRTSPMGSIIITEGAYTNSSSVNITPSANDALSGVAHMRFSNDDILWTDWITYSSHIEWQLTEDEGEKKVYAQFKDNAGLISPTYLFTITLDQTPPTIAITTPSSNREIRSSNLTVTWSSSDETSGISQNQIRIDAGPWINLEMNMNYTISDLSDGDHTLDIRAVDRAGNTRQETINFIVNTSLLLGPGYGEETVIAAIIIIALLGVAIYVIKIRKKN